MPPKPMDPLAEEVAMHKDDRRHLGTSDKDKFMRERLTTAISAVKTLMTLQNKRDWLHRRAQEDATRLADELQALKRKDHDSEHQHQPRSKRTRPRRACSASLSHAERLEMVKDEHDRAVERVRQIEREYAEPLAQAEAAADKARCGVLELSLPGFVAPRCMTGHPSPPTVRPTVCPTSENAPAKDTAPHPADVSEDESLPPPTGPYASIEIDMTRRLSQSLQGRKLGLIYRCFKTTYATTWNDGEQEVKAVIKVTPRNDTNQMFSTRNEIIVYHRLRSLQGTCIPRLLDYGRTELNGKRYFAVVVERIEDRKLGAQQMPDFRPSIGKLSDRERAACRDAIGKMHDLGVIHWDIRGSNLMFRDNLPGPSRIPVFIGLACAAILDNISDEDEDEDYACLKQMFDENHVPFD